MNWTRLLIEALIVGIFTVVIGYLVIWITRPRILYTSWSMMLTLFLIGFFMHLAAEALKLNKWYCYNGEACNTEY